LGGDRKPFVRSNKAAFDGSFPSSLPFQFCVQLNHHQFLLGSPFYG